MSIIESLIETQEFATLPPVAARVLSMLENENIDIRDITKVIETDVSLTLKLLRVANSPLYAVRTEISTILQAILTLGLNRVTNIVLGVSIFSKFLLSSQHHAAKLMEKFWWHSSCTGIVAKALAKKINKNFRENEFIGGLIHDIGKLAMFQFDASNYTKVVTMITEDSIIDTEAEKNIFGVSHNEVGKEIAKLWKIPSELTNIIEYHNSPNVPPVHEDLISVVRLADLFCEIWGAGFYEGQKMLKVAEEASWQTLCESFPELKSLDVEVFTFELENEFKHSSEFLSIMVSES